MEQMAFLRLLQSLGSLDRLPADVHDGVPDLEPTAINYEGISNGSTHGQAFLAYAPDILAGCLVAGASRMTELLEYQDRTTPDGSDPFLMVSIPSFIPNATPPDIWMGLGLFSLIYDPQDPQNHASFIYRDPIEVAGTTKKPSILVLEGVRDTYTKPIRGPLLRPGRSGGAPAARRLLPERRGRRRSRDRLVGAARLSCRVEQPVFRTGKTDLSRRAPARKPRWRAASAEARRRQATSGARAAR